MEIRPCNPGDQEIWIRLNREFMAYELADEEFWNHTDAVTDEKFAATYLAALADPDHITLMLVEESGTPIGFANLMTIFSIWAHGKALILDDLFLLEEYRRQGKGREIMRELECYAKDRGFRRLQFQSEKTNPGAKQFYENLGYRSSEMHFYVKYL